MTGSKERSRRYSAVSNEKAAGATYTPEILGDFVAGRMLEHWEFASTRGPLRILDPAVGEGQLLLSLLAALRSHGVDLGRLAVDGFDTEGSSIETARRRLAATFPEPKYDLRVESFLEHAAGKYRSGAQRELFSTDSARTYDAVIANPPYIRTQVMGSAVARSLARDFRLTGRVDASHAFLLAIAQVLAIDGIAGIIVSNRFMTTRSGAAARRALRERLGVRAIWDLGDTRLFNAAVLPCVIILGGRDDLADCLPEFTSIYATTAAATHAAQHPIDALRHEGIVQIPDGRCFHVRKGHLNVHQRADTVWAMGTEDSDRRLQAVLGHTWKTFGEIARVRVGVKTCADDVFIRSDWEQMPPETRPELLRPIATHHMARRYRAHPPVRQILYPHQRVNGRREAVNLSDYPSSRDYLKQNRQRLESRAYVLSAGRNWYEIWVPQDPDAWRRDKLVFRDISDRPIFWMDRDGLVVNGDCYWMVSDKNNSLDILWLALAVGNSPFVEWFYDRCFHNKLYAGRRRFIAQYVERFPLPDPAGFEGKSLIKLAKRAYVAAGTEQEVAISRKINALVWKSFGLIGEEIGG